MSAARNRFDCERCGNEPHGGVLYLLYEHHGGGDAEAGVALACEWAARWIERSCAGERLPDAGDGLIRLRVEGEVVLIQGDGAIGVAYLSGEAPSADDAVLGIANGLRGKRPDPPADPPAP